MASCRCDDIKKIKRDISTMWDINQRVGFLADADVTVVKDLNDVGDFTTSTFFAHDDFEKTFKELHGKSTEHCEALKSKVASYIEQLENDLEAAKKEDHEYHIEQFKNFVDWIIPGGDN